MALSHAIATNFFHFPNSVSLPHSSRSSSQYPFLLQNLKHKPTSRIYSPSPSSKEFRGSILSLKCYDAESSELEPGGGGNGDGKENDTPKRVPKNISKLSEKVLDIYWGLIKNLGDNIIFTIHPTMEDGTTVGVKWKLGWSNTHVVPLGKGLSIQSSHGYGGKLLIRNVEMIIEPLLQLEPMRMVRLKTIAAIANILEKMNLNWMTKQKSMRAASIPLGFFFIVLSLFFFQFSFR